jgi:hypothetical protein
MAAAIAKRVGPIVCIPLPSPSPTSEPPIANAIGAPSVPTDIKNAAIEAAGVGNHEPLRRALKHASQARPEAPQIAPRALAALLSEVLDLERGGALIRAPKEVVR